MGVCTKERKGVQAFRPSGWTDGVEFVAGQGDAAAFPYNDMCLVGGKFARILSFCPDEADMLCVETKHAVSNTPLTRAISVRRSWASLRPASPRRRADITELCSLLVHDSNSSSSWAGAGGASMVLFRVRLAQ